MDFSEIIRPIGEVDKSYPCNSIPGFLSSEIIRAVSIAAGNAGLACARQLQAPVLCPRSIDR
jgi:hypothetical protein